MLKLVTDCGSDLIDCAPGEPALDPRPSATIHYLYDPSNPPINAIVSVARRLQEVLIEFNALPAGAPLPFPALAPVDRS